MYLPMTDTNYIFPVWISLKQFKDKDEDVSQF